MSDHIPPLVFAYDGEAMVPVHPRLADKHFVVGEKYALAPCEVRSAASHKHYFGSLNEAHDNLPEEAAQQFPTTDHLRKYCLIRAGYRDERSIACSSKAEAQRIAAFVKPMDDFAIVTVTEGLVTVYTAKSQSMRAMGKKVFQESKDKVLDLAWGLCGVDAREAAANVGKAA